MPVKPHPKLPPASPAACAHEHLKFEDGTLHLVCIDCDQVWEAVWGKHHGTNMALAGVPMYAPRNTRHDRWVMPRTDKLPPPPKAKTPNK